MGSINRTKISLTTLIYRRTSLFFFIFLVASSTQAQNTTLDDIKSIEIAKITEGAETQRQIDRVDDERLQMSNEYQSAITQVSNLEKFNETLRKTILSQQQQKELLQSQFSGIVNLEKNIVPMMTDMLDALESFIALDLPFLLTERENRVKKLRVLLAEADVSNSEKYRRVLEAYQIENDYGRTIEAYDATLDGSDDGQLVSFLKIGRIAFVYQTLDASESYRWSPENSQWQMLDPLYDDDIHMGIKMANEQLPSNLLFVPVSVQK